MIGHPAIVYPTGACLIECYLDMRLLLRAEVELGGSGETKHDPGLISNHANRLDLPGTSDFGRGESYRHFTAV